MTAKQQASMNRHRQWIGAEVVAAFKSTVDRVSGPVPSQPPRDVLVDLLKNLRHYAGAVGLDFDTCSAAANRHYQAERTV